MTIRIRVGVIYSRIVSVISKELVDSLDTTFSEWAPNAFFSTKYIEGKWDGFNHCFSKKTKIFQTGLLSNVISYLQQNGYNVDLIDDRFHYTFRELGPSQVQLNSDQKKAVDSIIRSKRGIIEAPVRFGKTIIAIDFARRVSLFPFLFISQELTPASQALQKFTKWLPKGVSFGFCGDGEVVVGDITICTIQTLASALGIIIKKKELKEIDITQIEKKISDDDKKPIRDLVEQAKVIVLDEAHHGVSRIHQEFLRKPRRAEFIIGLTATVPPSLRLERAIGPVVFSLSFDDAIKRNYILPPKIFMYSYDDPRDLDLRGLTFSEIYNLCVTENSHRNDLIVKIVKSAVKQGKSVVVTVKFVKHGKLLESLIPNSVFMYRQHSRKERDDLIAQLENRKIDVIISTLIKEAVDIPSLNMVVNAAGGEGYISTIQKLRSITPDPQNDDKKVGLYVDFWDDYKYLKKHSKKRFRQYKKEKFQIVERHV